MAKRRTKEELAEFDSNVIALRRSGLTFDEIGKRLNDSHVNAHRAFQRAIKRIPAQSIEELRILHNQRLEMMYLVASNKARDGRYGAQFLKQALDALKQIAELNGLNAPQVIQSEITGKDGGPIETATPVNILGVSREEIDAMTQEERDVVRAICVKQIARQKASNVH